MKNLTAFLLGAAGLGAGAPLCAANLGGSDDFNDNAKDSAKWGTDLSFGLVPGALAESNSRLEFTATGTDETVRWRPWILNLGSYVENWDVQLDTTVSTTAGVGKAMGFGLEIRRAGATNLRMGIEHESAQSAWDYYSYLLDSSPPGSGTGLIPGAAVGALRIAFDANTKILTSFFNADGPANGYVWTQAASFGIAGSGGQTGNADWGMTSSDGFQVLVSGSSLNRAVSVGLVFADNFRAVPEPSTAWMLLSGGLLLARRCRPGRGPEFRAP